MKKYINKDGSLSQYSFSTGWKEVYEFRDGSGDKIVITKESDFYRVKGFIDDTLAFWKTFKRVKEARGYARRHGKLDCVKLP